MVIIETSLFTKRIDRLMSQEDYRALQNMLIKSPDAGDIIQASGGIRKVRWGGSGKGKRGGSRLIYYQRLKKSLSWSLTMNDDVFNELLSSVKEAGKIMRGESQPSRQFEWDTPNVKTIRENIGFSQSHFATLIGVSIRTLQNWEQGHRQPTGPAKVLLKLVHADPESVFKNLHLNPQA